ncbi:hypothetical protein EV138_3026 [Kribbella voronezhensis]|uniref:Uncharacterized protein n=1 Tax=Kribbella voronezhensis TaxID=2512212 RepID=A0A4R7TDL2_9ACTN|nr:hypothetical protein [Kribbella voronezhensis]TDU89458.1 hypothetical protein EV138_3026 [Kribbella voronezhensis]
MNLPDIPDGPAWLGWVLFVLVLAVLIFREIGNYRGQDATRRLTELQADKAALELLTASISAQGAQLDAISRALAADSPARPSEEDLVHIPDEYSALVRHLRSRERARQELPNIVAQLAGLQARRMEIERRLTQHLPGAAEEAADLRKELLGVTGGVASLVQMVAESPRVYVSANPPKDPVADDIWIDTSTEIRFNQAGPA